MAKAARYKYQVDPEVHARINATRSAKRKQVKAQLTAYKAEKSCTLCPESEPECLEFHHIDPRTKDSPPANLYRDKGWSFEKMVEYFERTCIVLCSNCHKKVHKALREKQHKPLARKTRRKT